MMIQRRGIVAGATPASRILLASISMKFIARQLPPLEDVCEFWVADGENDYVYLRCKLDGSVYTIGFINQNGLNLCGKLPAVSPFPTDDKGRIEVVR